MTVVDIVVQVFCRNTYCVSQGQNRWRIIKKFTLKRFPVITPFLNFHGPFSNLGCYLTPIVIIINVNVYPRSTFLKLNEIKVLKEKTPEQRVSLRTSVDNSDLTSLTLPATRLQSWSEVHNSETQVQGRLDVLGSLTHGRRGSVLGTGGMSASFD